MQGLPRQTARQVGELPRFLDDLINNPPKAGTGVHDWMFQVARNLHCHYPVSQIEALLKTKLANCGRQVPDREIKAAISNSVRFAYAPKQQYQPAPQYETPHEANLSKIEALAEDGGGLADLMESSPYTHHERDAEFFIDQLFPSDSLLCCGLSPYEFATKPREAWRGSLGQQSFIVPSPMSAHTGLTQDGKISEHSLNNTGPRRFLVVEFDFSVFARDKKTPTKFAPMLFRLGRRISVSDICSSILLWLNSLWRMTLAVSSGGKSIHGWWYCAGISDETLKPFWNYCLGVGADPKTWLRSQFIRMPDGTREPSVHQPVLYFNPDTLTK